MAWFRFRSLVPEKRFQRFGFRFRFLEKRFRRFRFPVPVRFLRRPVTVQSFRSGHLVAPYRAILRYYRCDTPYRAMLFQGGSQSSPKWCDTPPWHLVSNRHISAIPHFATYRAIIVRYPTQTSTNGFSIPSLQVSRDVKKYRCWASKSCGHSP